MLKRMGTMATVVACVAMSGAALAQAPMAEGHHDMGAAQGSTASGPAVEVQRNYAAAKANILKSADKMPADAYSYQPEPDIRIFARVLNHVSEAQFRSCGVINGVKDIAKPPADTADKATVVAALKASFEECDKAFASLTDANLTEMFSVGPVKRSRIGLLWGTASHDNEQYATLALYLRLKGIAPPSSEK